MLGTNLEAVAASVVAREGVIWTLGASDDLNTNLIHFEAGRGVGEHLNEEVDVIFVGVSGSGTVEVGGEEYALGPGKLVLCPQRCLAFDPKHVRGLRLPYRPQAAGAS